MSDIAKQMFAFALLFCTLFVCNQSRAEQRAVFVKICRICDNETDCRTYFFKRIIEGQSAAIDTAECKSKRFSPADVPADIQSIQRDTITLEVDCI